MVAENVAALTPNSCPRGAELLTKILPSHFLFGFINLMSSLPGWFYLHACDVMLVYYYYFFYSMDFITFIVVQQSSQPSFIAFLSQTPSPSPHPPTCLLGNHKFFKDCESVSVLHRSSLYPFFRFHM